MRYWEDGNFVRLWCLAILIRSSRQIPVTEAWSFCKRTGNDSPWFASMKTWAQIPRTHKKPDMPVILPLLQWDGRWRQENSPSSPAGWLAIYSSGQDTISDKWKLRTVTWGWLLTSLLMDRDTLTSAAHCPGAPGPLPSTTKLGLHTMPLHGSH